MGMFDDVWNALDGLGQQVTKGIGPVAKQVYNHLDQLSQDAKVHLGPAVEDALTQANAVAQNAVKHAAPVAAEGLRHLTSFSQQATKQIADSDWAFIEEFGQEMGKHIGKTADEVWQSMITGQIFNDLEQAGTAFVGGVQEHLPGMSDRAMKWITEHPSEAAALIACILAVPTATAVTPAILGWTGFTLGGIEAGMHLHYPLLLDLTQIKN